MTRTRVLAALLAGLTLAGLGTAATALGSDDPAAAAPVTVVAQTRTTSPTSTSHPDARRAADATGLTADEAVSRAVAHLGGGTVTKVEWEIEHGRAVWEVDVRRDSRITEVHVDIATGTVTRVDDDGRERGAGTTGPGDDRGGDDRGRVTTGAGTAATTAPATAEPGGPRAGTSEAGVGGVRVVGTRGAPDLQLPPLLGERRLHGGADGGGRHLRVDRAGGDQGARRDRNVDHVHRLRSADSQVPVRPG